MSTFLKLLSIFLRHTILYTDQHVSNAALLYNSQWLEQWQPTCACWLTALWCRTAECRTVLYTKKHTTQSVSPSTDGHSTTGIFWMLIWRRLMKISWTVDWTRVQSFGHGGWKEKRSLMNIIRQRQNKSSATAEDGRPTLFTSALRRIFSNR